MTISINKPSVTGAVVLIFMGAMFFLISSLLVKSYGDKSKCTEQVSAIVTENIERRKTSHKNRGSRYTYAPVFEYEYNGKAYSYRSNVYSSPAEYSVGERTTIQVNPNDPTEVYYKPKGGTVIMNVVFKIVGVGIAGGGVVMLISCLVKKNRESF